MRTDCWSVIKEIGRAETEIEKVPEEQVVLVKQMTEEIIDLVYDWAESNNIELILSTRLVRKVECNFLETGFYIPDSQARIRYILKFGDLS